MSADLRARLIAQWPDCIVRGCTRKCCLRLRSPRCYPHTLGLNEASAAAIAGAGRIRALAAGSTIGGNDEGTDTALL